MPKYPRTSPVKTARATKRPRTNADPYDRQSKRLKQSPCSSCGCSCAPSTSPSTSTSTMADSAPSSRPQSSDQSQCDDHASCTTTTEATERVARLEDTVQDLVSDVSDGLHSLRQQGNLHSNKIARLIDDTHSSSSAGEEAKERVAQLEDTVQDLVGDVSDGFCGLKYRVDVQDAEMRRVRRVVELHGAQDTEIRRLRRVVDMYGANQEVMMEEIRRLRRLVE